MIIKKEYDNYNPIPYPENEAYSIMLQSQSVKKDLIVPINTICVKTCCDKYNVFAEYDVISYDFRNDKTSLIEKKQINSDTITFILIKNDIEYTLNDDTYGVYYASFNAQNKYTGFVIDWFKILNILGTGYYKYKITKTILGVTSTYISGIFNLQEYSDELADGTVLIQTWDNGTIVNKDVIYKDLLPDGWYQSIRINGKFTETNPKTINDTYYNQQNKLIDIQKRKQQEYQLETHLLSVEISDKLIYDMLLSDKILISDFNAYNKRNIKQLEVSHVEDKENYFNYNNNTSFIIKFVSKYDNIIKNNF